VNLVIHLLLLQKKKEFNIGENMYCKKHNYTTDFLECPICEYEDYIYPQKVSNENGAGGIASYYTSPLALRNEYKAETNGDIEGAYFSLVDRDKKIFDPDYVYWLESKLVKQH
jgi:hypothetical protein